MITFIICLLIVYFLGSVVWGLKKFVLNLFAIVLLPVWLVIIVICALFMKTESFDKQIEQLKV